MKNNRRIKILWFKGDLRVNQGPLSKAIWEYFQKNPLILFINCKINGIYIYIVNDMHILRFQDFLKFLGILLN